jgi:hypothetical protein
MRNAAETTDERLNRLVDEIADLTGEDYVTAMCQALEERRDRLVGRRSGRVVRVSLELTREDASTRARGA